MTKQMILVTSMAIGLGAALAPPARAAAGPVAAASVPVDRTDVASDDDKSDELYEQGRDAIEEGKYDRALDRFNRLVSLKTPRTDAALYWKAYCQVKLGQRADALTTLADLQKQFADSRWIKDAKALEIEVRQASGQTVSPDSQGDDELKLLALRGIMDSDPDRALPIIEQMLNGPNSPKVKDRALFVLSQSNSPRARQVLGNVAKGGANPDLQLRAIKYLGIMGGNESRQMLSDVYGSSTDPAIKRAIIRSFMVSGDRARLLALAKGEKDAAMRGEAVQQLGVMGAHAELAELYQTETEVAVKKRILNAMFVGGDADKLADLAKNEKDPELRKTAIHDLGLIGASRTGETLKAIYLSDTTPDVRKACVQGLFLQENAKTLVELARAEKNPDMKKDIVQKLSLMHSKEATDYLLELLK